jgi:hypothetical protein
MKPVDQTIFYDPAEPPRGNCLAACVASLLELPIEEVPNFCAAEQWLEGYISFLREHGCDLVSNRYFPDGPFPEDLGSGIGGLFIAAGQSPLGVNHAVIIDGRGNLIHDPHPSRAGVCRVVEVDVIERVNV